MANVIDSQVILDGPRNYVVKFTGILDSSDATIVPAVELKDPLNNDVRMRLWGFRVDHIEFAISAGLEVQLYWHDTNNQQIAPLSGRGFFGHTNYGGLVPDRTRPGFNGNIDIITQGFQPGTVSNFTVILELVKLYDV